MQAHFGTVQAHFEVVQAHVQISKIVQAHFGIVQAHFGIVQAHFEIVQAHFGIVQAHSEIVQAHFVQAHLCRRICPQDPFYRGAGSNLAPRVCSEGVMVRNTISATRPLNIRRIHPDNNRQT